MALQRLLTAQYLIDCSALANNQSTNQTPVAAEAVMSSWYAFAALSHWLSGKINSAGRQGVGSKVQSRLERTHTARLVTVLHVAGGLLTTLTGGCRPPLTGCCG